MQTVVELPEFQKRSAELLVESECASIINYLAAHPLAGDIMQGTGGIRKRQQSLKIIDRTPQGPALVLLKVVAKGPQAVLRALSQ